MISYPFKQELYTNVLSKSRAIQGRFFYVPRMGRELSTDEMEQVLKDLVIPEPLKKKYPLVIQPPPISYAECKYNVPGWETYRDTLFFLTTTYYSGTNQVMSPNPNTGTSTHTVPQDWHDMKRSAVSFLRVLDYMQRKAAIGDRFRLDQDKPATITPISHIGVDRASGVRVDFLTRLYIGCDIEDYTPDDLARIAIPVNDSHPEHQL